MPAERHFRAFARRAVTLAVTISTEAGSRPAKLVNLGLGGACVVLSEKTEPGRVVTLEVHAPNLWDPLVVVARVAWVSASGSRSVLAGLSFDHSDRAALPSLVELLGAYGYE
jgi:Tfp pilus assembly protein PilZ